MTISSKQSEKIFTFLLGFAFASLFFRHGLMHLVALLFVVVLLIVRPRLPWIPPFWWLLLFIIWEWLSNFLGPYHGRGMEGAGIGYHFLFLLIPLSLPVINRFAILLGVTVGAFASALLIWLQIFFGVDISASIFRINWEGELFSSRPVGFNTRPWTTQFIHSLVFLSILPYLGWKKAYSWFLAMALLSGAVLPQIRAVIGAFLTSFSIQMLFTSKERSRKQWLTIIMLIILLVVISISSIAFLRANFFTSLEGGNGRDKIFVASFEMFKQYPHTGLGGARYFDEHYQQAWKDLGWHKEDKPQFLEVKIGHTHNDALMLLVHHGWPALFIWTAFIIHCLLFVWRNGSARERTLFISLVSMHHVAGLAENYLDFSNTAYAIFLCYGLALHGPILRWQKSNRESQRV